MYVCMLSGAMLFFQVFIEIPSFQIPVTQSSYLIYKMLFYNGVDYSFDDWI